MDVREVLSLGYRTDLALLRLGETQVEDRGDHLVLRSADNPSFWWGNFLLLPQVPAPEETDAWLERFARTYPAGTHVALGFDGTDGRMEDLTAFADRGLTCEALTVMSATEVTPPPRPNSEATYRSLDSDADWAQSIELRVACIEDQDPVTYRDFAVRKVATYRQLVDRGHGGWFGAFVDGELVAQMGLYAAGAGLARFQSVETHPDARGRGLAGTLVHRVSRHGLDRLGAHTLVMVADPSYLAVRVYRSVGFVDGETQLQVEGVQR